MPECHYPEWLNMRRNNIRLSKGVAQHEPESVAQYAPELVAQYGAEFTNTPICSHSNRTASIYHLGI